MSTRHPMPKRRPYTRRQAARCGNNNSNKESISGKGTTSENATQLVKRPRGRPRKNPPTSIPVSALNDLNPETHNSNSWLRSGNERTVVTGKLRRGTRKGHLTNAKKVVQIEHRKAPIGRPVRRLMRLQVSKTTLDDMNLKNGENTSVQRSNRTRVKPNEAKPDQETLRNGQNTSVQTPNTTLKTGRPRGRPRKNPQSTTDKPGEVGHVNNVSEELPLTPGQVEFEPKNSVSKELSLTSGEVELEQDNDVLEEPPFTPGEVSLGQDNGVLDEPPFTSDKASLEHDGSVSEESPYSPGEMEFEQENSVSKEPTFSTGEINREHENNMEPEEPTISEGYKYLLRPSRKSERVRRQTGNSTVEPVDRDEQDSASNDEASSGSERDSSALERPRKRHLKRRRTSSSDFEIEEGEEDDSSDEESSCEDSPTNERPRKHQRISGSEAEDAGLETGVSVLTRGMRRAKKQYCLYCSKSFTKLARHLGMRHYDQEDVVQALSLPKNSSERKKLLARIRNSGNRAHNNHVLKEGKGVLIPCRAFKSKEPIDIEYCPGCQGMFPKDSVMRHVKTCQFVTEKDCADPEGDEPSFRVGNPSPKDVSEVITGMYEDDVAVAIRGDKLLQKLGQHFFDKRYACEYILQKLRELGRLLLSGQKITPLKKIEDYIRLSNWDYLAAAVKDVAGYCESTQTFAILRYAVSLKRSFRSLAEVIKHDANASGDKETAQNAEEFLNCLLIKWHQEFSAPGKSSSNSSSSVVAEAVRTLQPQEGSGDKNCASSPEDDDDDIKRDVGVGDDENDNNDLEKDDNDDQHQQDDDSDIEEDDSSDGDDGNAGGIEDDSSQCSDRDGQDDGVPPLLLENKTDNATNGSLNTSCDGTQNDTVPKPVLESEVNPQTVATAELTSSPVNGHQESGSVTASKMSDAFLSSLVTANSKDISIVPKGNKRPYCLFCKKQVTKLSRHLAARHSEEEGVAKALSYPKCSKERKLYLKLLLRKGNREHNIQVLKEGKGAIIPSKWVHGKPGDFMHCPYCDGLYIKRCMSRHLKDCPCLKEEDRPVLRKGKRGSMKALYAFIEPPPDHVSKDLWNILAKMHQDEITLAAKGDKHALQLGEQLLDKGQGDDAIREDYIRQRLRELGRLLVSCQRITPMYSLLDFILPKNWDHLVAVVKDVVGYDDETESIPNRTTLSHIYRSLQKIGGFVESDAVSQKDEQMIEYARSFNKDFEEKWRKFFPPPDVARKSQQRRKNGVKLLPFTEDIKNLYTYLKDKVGECLSALCTSPSQAVWENLAKIVLAQLVMFNRRKIREVAQLTLKEFNTKEAYGMPDDTAEDLTPFERELCKYTCRIEIARATGDNVQLLVPPALANIMETMLHKRLLCSIRYDNIFMFAQPRSRTHYSSVDSLESFAKDCGAKHVKKLASDGLREHVAVISQLLYLRDMHQVTDFMGLSLATHLRNDCVQQETLQLARLGKCLTAMEKEQSRPTEQNVQETIVTLDEIVQQTEWSSAEEDGDEDYQPSRPDKSQQVPAKEKKRRSVAKNKWTEAEVQAVERHMAKYIQAGKTPGKKACTACIMAEPEALKARKWQAIKFYTKNRITSIRRQTQ